MTKRASGAIMSELVELQYNGGIIKDRYSDLKEPEYREFYNDVLREDNTYEFNNIYCNY